ncbi:MAG: hypothetical protein MUO52_15050 [Desulfobacterales bacterium]|nr:hypothetical protein [Desulfobacterales bacterium]
MQAGANAAGKNLRPHAKTHKCSTLAKMQLAKGAVGVSVAKVSEVEGVVYAGVHGVLIGHRVVDAWPIELCGRSQYRS